MWISVIQVLNIIVTNNRYTWLIKSISWFDIYITKFTFIWSEITTCLLLKVIHRLNTNIIEIYIYLNCNHHISIEMFKLLCSNNVTQNRILWIWCTILKCEVTVLFPSKVWDVISNEDAVKIVASTPDKEKAAQKLVKCAIREWKRKRRGIAVDDMSAICLFFSSPSSHLANKVFQ